MNAYELADELDTNVRMALIRSQNMLRQQADRITELEKRSAEPVAYVNSMCNDNIDWKTDPMSIDGQPLYTTPQIKELSYEEIKPLLDRIQNYLECGGLFNPECIKHDKVRDLIMDCKTILKKASEK